MLLAFKVSLASYLPEVNELLNQRMAKRMFFYSLAVTRVFVTLVTLGTSMTVASKLATLASLFDTKMYFKLKPCIGT